MSILHKENQDYDAWLHWKITTECNLNCPYCFRNLAVERKAGSKLLIKIPGIILRKLAKACCSLWKEKSGGTEVIKINALLKALDRADKVFAISFTGGEPFLVRNLIEACEEITKKHCIGFNTNLTSDRIAEFAGKINPEKVLFIVASLHIKELERLGLLNRYINNFILCKGKGFNISADVVAHPSLFGEAEKQKRFFKEKGVDISFSPFLGEYNGRFYPVSYTEEEIAVFGLNRMMLKAYCPKGKLCNAGYNAALVLPQGTIQPCFSFKQKIGNIYGKIKFNAGPLVCHYDFCGCPFNAINPYLFEKAIKVKGAHGAVS